MILAFCYSNLTWKTGGFERASTITIVLQVDRLTTCASRPKHDEAELLLFENYINRLRSRPRHYVINTK